MLPTPSQLRPRVTPKLPVRPSPGMLLRQPQVAVLLNANARRVNPRLRAELEALLPPGDVFYSSTITEARSFARIILERRYQTLMIGGGDGTQTTMMNLLLGEAERMSRVGRPQLPDLGVLRLGTGNALGYLSKAGKPTEDLRHVLSPRKKTASPLRLVEDASTGWVFPFGSVGYDARLLNDYQAFVDGAPDGSWRLGMRGYLLAAATRTVPSEMFAPRASVRLTAVGRASMIDPASGEPVELQADAPLFSGPAGAVVFGSSPYYGYGMQALPAATLRGDRFQIRVATASPLQLVAAMPRLWKGTLRHAKMVDFLVEGVRLKSDRPLPMQLAGDAKGEADALELRLCDRVFRLVEGTGASR